MFLYISLKYADLCFSPWAKKQPVEYSGLRHSMKMDPWAKKQPAGYCGLRHSMQMDPWAKKQPAGCSRMRYIELCKKNYAMVVYRSHDIAGSLANGVFISRPTGNPDPLAKSRPTGKIQTYL